MASRIVEVAERHAKTIVVVILVLAVGLGMREALLSGNALRGWDAVDYDNMGTNLLAGKGFVREGTGEVRGQPVEFRLRGHRPPVYPIFLALVYRVSDHSLRAVYVTQVLIFALTGYVVYRLALLCFGRQFPALLTLLLYALYLPLQSLVGQVSTETLFALFLALQVYFLVRWAREHGTASVIFSAVFLGLAILTRPTPFLLPVFLLFFFVAARTLGLGARLRTFVIYVLVALAVVSPWMIRQAIRFHALVPVTTGGGITFWEGAGPAGGRTTPGWALPGVPDETVGEFRDLMVPGPDGYTQETAMDKLARKRALEIIRRNPAHYLWLTLAKAPKFWLGIDLESPKPLGAMSLKTAAALLMGIVLLLTAVVGAFSVLRRRMGLFLAPALVIFYFSLVHMFPYVLHRYSLPIHPLVMLFSAAGILVVLERWLKTDSWA